MRKENFIINNFDAKDMDYTKRLIVNAEALDYGYDENLIRELTSDDFVWDMDKKGFYTELGTKWSGCYGE